MPIARFTKKMPTDHPTPADGVGTVCGLFVETSDKTGLAARVAPVVVGPYLRNEMPDF